MKVVTIVGARPQFIKCAPVSRELRKAATEILVHTGQHYDYLMSRVFFEELEIPEPEYNLEVGSCSHGVQTGLMLERLEAVLVRERPDKVVVYGDTNSTLAGALAAAKLGIPVAHVEAGLRSFNRRMPEEINRVLTDHVSSQLFAPTETAVENLAREGIWRGVELVGDVMCDQLLASLPLVERRATELLTNLGVEPEGYYLATVHRAENTDDASALEGILTGLAHLDCPVLFPIHPRTRDRIAAAGLTSFLGDGSTIRRLDPVRYLDMLALERHAAGIFTDSGGVQKEAYLLGTACVTLREETEWVETVASGWNVLVGRDPERIRAAAPSAKPSSSPAPVYGRGQAAREIVRGLLHGPSPPDLLASAPRRRGVPSSRSVR